MCGIFGKINYIHKQKVSESELIAPLNLMAHRGPDDEGIFIDRYVGLAMKRLKIIDLETGHQPMFNETKDIVIVHNGEIYNYLELKKELQPKHRFSTASDTEVIVHLYEEYGEKCLEKLNGMFSFAIWDSKKELLFIARDRIGIKPLFYSIQNGSLYFSSEIRALISCNDISRKIDEHALINYLSFYYVSAPWTIYKNIRRLLPGHYLTIHGNDITIKRYWGFESNPIKINEAEAISSVQSVLLNSVKRHLQSEVPLGVFLSSGLDSTAIVAMMGKLGQKTRTFTIGYENGRTYNEMNEAKLVAFKYGTEHYDCILKPKDVKTYLPKIIEHLAEPHGDWTQVAFYFLSKESRKTITVALSGAGGDELFAGYPTLIAAKLAKYYKCLPSFAKNLISSVVQKLPSSYERLSFDFKAKSFIAGADLTPEKAHLRYKEIFSKEERQELLYNIPISDPFNVFDQHLKNCREKEILNKLLYLDMNVFLPDCVLQIIDTTTMMNSQECRVPFLDLELIELSQKIPVEMKIRGFTTKYILRKALRKYLPDKLTKMPKKGFVMPTGFWLQKELNDFIIDIIEEAEKKNRNEFNFKYIKTIVNEHVSGKKDNTRKITCLISLFLWLVNYQ